MSGRTIFIWTDESKQDLRRCFNETRASEFTGKAFEKDLQRRFLQSHPECRLSDKSLRRYAWSLLSDKALPAAIYKPADIWSDEMRMCLKVLQIIYKVHF